MKVGTKRKSAGYSPTLEIRPRRFERPTFGFGDQRSIHLSYGRVFVNCITERPATFSSCGPLRLRAAGLRGGNRQSVAAGI